MDGALFGVVLVEPLAVVRAGLARLITEQPELALKADVGTAHEALSAVRDLPSKTTLVVVVGMHLQAEQDSFWLIRQIHEMHPTVRILAMGGEVDEGFVSRALFVGADGFADQTSDPQEFVDAIVSCAAGEMVITGAFRGQFALMADGIEAQAAASELLSDRERQVLEVVAEGLTARATAERLGLAERTITTHLHRIYAKLEVSSRLAAINVARQRGLLKPSLRVVS